MSITAQALHSHKGAGYEMWNRFGWDWNTATEGVDCGGDVVFRQTVPDTSSSDWKSSDGRQSSVGDDQ